MCRCSCNNCGWNNNNINNANNGSWWGCGCGCGCNNWGRVPTRWRERRLRFRFARNFPDKITGRGFYPWRENSIRIP